MSFVDLATLTLHRRNELEARINVFLSKCDHAVDDIQKLKVQAQNFVLQLNCEPSELKERFLSCMKQLDEYTYLITDFNLAVGKLEENSTAEYTPVHDTTAKTPLPTPRSGPINLMDVLSEPTPSTSTACPNLCPTEKPKRIKVPKEDQLLIAFSSSSCSSESVPQTKTGMVTKEVQCELAADMNNMSMKESCNLPAQVVLQTDLVYSATIMSIDGVSFWVITDSVDDVCKLMKDMTDFYKSHQVELTLDEIRTLNYCAFFDDDSDCFYRALFIKLIEHKGMTNVEVFLVDTGEVRTADISTVQPLDPCFCDRPPYARCCHLAGIDALSYHSKQLMVKQEMFIKKYIGTHCKIEVDDNTSESLGVYVILAETDEVLNDILIEEGLALPIDKPQTDSLPVYGPPEISSVDSDESDINVVTHCPEYEDPVEAVTGYSNRDEADICKHYKGGPEKTCFKGPRCTKRHVMKHPDGWTLDRVEVAGKIRSIPLPAPDTWHKVHVTCVCHFNRLYVQFVKEKEPEEVPNFGVILPPTSLTTLVRDMNSPASRMAYKPLTLTPAPGELVAALYPLDNQWYRARVLTVTRADQNVEVQPPGAVSWGQVSESLRSVLASHHRWAKRHSRADKLQLTPILMAALNVMYIDYGNVVWIKEDEIRVLEPRYLTLPIQAVRCVLAGVTAKTNCSRQWAAAKHSLTHMAQERTLSAHVIGRDYDELIIELYDEEGYNIAEQLAANDVIELKEYSITDDSKVTQKIVPA